ncbi:hypothetical protein CEXT_270151 [Caerostris extrusa]|uniref:Uncharacterized protein n=1 Tax=Caerostris extrusa TaxID=172846 RepID=A0AAV4WZC0_CAEEX|nr:hypothetical protein CEXT_270151 [Caerostris extrusa]
MRSPIHIGATHLAIQQKEAPKVICCSLQEQVKCTLLYWYCPILSYAPGVQMGGRLLYLPSNFREALKDYFVDKTP